MICCNDVFSAIAISFNRAAVTRDMQNVMLVSVFSNLPWGLVRNSLMFRFLTADPFGDESGRKRGFPAMAAALGVRLAPRSQGSNGDFINQA
jgi:hypothetical protein